MPLYNYMRKPLAANTTPGGRTLDPATYSQTMQQLAYMQGTGPKPGWLAAQESQDAASQQQVDQNYSGLMTAWNSPQNAAYAQQAHLQNANSLANYNEGIGMPRSQYFSAIGQPDPQAAPASSGFAPDVQNAMSAIASWQAGGSPQQAFSGQVHPNALTQPPMANQSLFQKNHWLPAGVTAHQGPGSITPWTGLQGIPGH